MVNIQAGILWWLLRILPISGAVLIPLFFIIGCGVTPVPFAGTTFRPGETGQWQKLNPDAITEIFGVGLSYARHISETGSDWKPDAPPPVFRKALNAFNRNGIVPYPSRQEFLALAEALEPGLGRKLDERFEEIEPLVDYEVELGIVLLEQYDRQRTMDPSYMLNIGFVLTGDFTSRSFMVLGEGQGNQYDYWGAAKSFSGFAVVGDRMWVPDGFPPDGSLEVMLETKVNGELRQRGSSGDNVYSVRQLLAYVASAYPDAPLQAGTVIMTGTPPGVAFQVPSWKRELADFFDLDRLTRMESVMDAYRDDRSFLRPGDVVNHEAGPFGSMNLVVR